MIDIPKTMKAWVVTRAGKPSDALELRTNWPTPAPPKAGEIMVRVSYAALNPGDIKMIPMKKNAVIGMDFVGEVVQVGPPAAASPPTVRVGIIVAGTIPVMRAMWHGMGALAEYVVVPAHSVAEKPEGLEESVAAGLLGVVGQTSVVLSHASSVHRGDRVLVNGASGGVGSIIIQGLHGMGVRVTGVCSAKNEALVRALGAEEVRRSPRLHIGTVVP